MTIRTTLFFSALATLLTAVILAGPTFYWLDSGEFVAAAWTLGVAHPPGHPLMSLIARLACYLPVGTIAFRVTLACAAEAAAATALVGLLATRLVDALAGQAPEATLTERRGPLVHLAVACAALTAGWSYALLFQAVRAEVYALNVLLVLGATYALLRFGQLGDRRYLLASAFIAALGLCNHHLLMLLAIPPAFLFLLLHGRPRPGWRRLIIGVLIAGTLGLSTFAYLPLRAARAPRVNWGAPTTVARAAWVVSARVFHQSLDRAGRETLGHRIGGAAFAVLGGLGPLGALLALGGLYLAWRRRETWRLAALLTFIGLFNLISPLLVGFDVFNPDAHGYLAVAVAAFAPGIAVLVFSVGQALVHHARRLAPLVILAVIVPGLQLRHLSRVDQRDLWAAEETARATLAQPPGTVALTSYFATLFGAWALQSTGDLRPDVAVIHRNFLGQPAYADTLATRHPALAAALHHWGITHHVDVNEL
ncbi:MAG: DUF2723 domain-containing protein, partial [Deltaproteobacteria bacterium]|nr:DUF2723 domain-containing protein [Deltaproteobacteria bacterium]